MCVIGPVFASGTYKFLIKSSQDDLTVNEQFLDAVNHSKHCYKESSYYYAAINRVGNESISIFIHKFEGHIHLQDTWRVEDSF